MVATATKITDKQWKLNVMEAQKLRGKSMDLLYERISLLVQVFDDDDFWTDNSLDDDEAAGKWLDKEVDEFRTIGAASPFWTLRACLTRWPKKSEWTNTTLRKMLATLTEEREERQDKAGRREAKRATVKELEEAVKRSEHAETTVKNLQSNMEQRTSELQKALSRIRELEAENAELRGRIMELERALSRQLVAA